MDLETEYEAIDNIRRWPLGLGKTELMRLEGDLMIVSEIEHNTQLGRDCGQAVNTLNMLLTQLNIIRMETD